MIFKKVMKYCSHICTGNHSLKRNKAKLTIFSNILTNIAIVINIHCIKSKKIIIIKLEYLFFMKIHYECIYLKVCNNFLKL